MGTNAWDVQKLAIKLGEYALMAAYDPAAAEIHLSEARTKLLCLADLLGYEPPVKRGSDAHIQSTIRLWNDIAHHIAEEALSPEHEQMVAEFLRKREDG